MLVLIGLIAGVSVASQTHVAHGHGVCAMMSCDAMKPCYPLTIIKECGPNNPILVISAVASSAAAMLFIFNGGLERSERRGAISNFFSLKHSRP